MHLPRTLVASVAALATLAVGGLAQAPAALAAGTDADNPTGLTSTEKDALLAVLDADNSRQLKQAVTSQALPDAVAAQGRDLAASVPGGLVLSDEAGLEHATGTREIARAALRRAIDPTQYQCEETPLVDYVTPYLMGPLADFDQENATPEELERYIEQVLTLLVFVQIGFTDGPTYDLLMNASDPRFARFGTGDINETPDISRVHFELKNFWDVNGRSIRLEPLKSTVVSSRADTDVVRWGKAVLLLADPASVPDVDTPENVTSYRYLGNLLHDWVDNDLPWLDGTNPVYTLNAFAFDPAGERPLLARTGKMMAYGDGMLAAQQEFGLLDVGPEAVMGHEYGHQVQYANKSFGTEQTPEATRRTELMADAYGSYFTAHAEGMALGSRKLGEVVEMFELTGDCGFDSPGHHGTPLQRQRAAVWGVELAQDAPCAKPSGKSSVTKRNGACRNGRQVAATKELVKKFDAALPELVAPDA